MLDTGYWMPDQVRHDVRTLDSQLLKKALKKLYYNLWCLRVFVAERLRLLLTKYRGLE
jgi:hypothetical protein